MTKTQAKNTSIINGTLIELESPAASTGKAFDGMSHGTFFDMLGRKVTLRKSELKKFVSNTKRMLEQTKGESGSVVGLPIDTKNHDKAESAGWITDVFLSDDESVIRFVPRWNQKGRDLIGGDIFRFFSPTIDLTNKVIIGGSLTNYPATRKQNGDLILRPIELSMGAKNNGSHKMTKEEIKVVDGTDEKDVSPVVALNLSAEEVKGIIADAVKAELQAAKPKEVETSDADFGAPDVDALLEKVRTEIAFDKASDVVDMSKVRESMMGTIRTALESEYKRMEKNAGAMLQGMLADSKRRTHVADFAGKVTGGTDANPKGLPVTLEKVEAVLLRIEDDALRTEVESILLQTWEHGLHEFGEAGFDGASGAKKQLPKFYASRLDDEVLTVSDLSNPVLAPDLGNVEEYDLSRWLK